MDVVPEVVGGVVVGVVGKGAWIVWAVDVVLVVGLRSLGVGGFLCGCALGVIGNCGGNGVVAGFLGWVGVGPSCGVGLGHLVVVVLVITFGE